MSGNGGAGILLLANSKLKQGVAGASLEDAAPGTQPLPSPLSSFLMTFGVSNLKTSARHAIRKQGSVPLGPRECAKAAKASSDPSSSDPSSSPSASVSSASVSSASEPASVSTRDVPEAVFVDPAGHQRSLALHLFRRNPMVSVTLSIPAGVSTAAVARVFREGLGMGPILPPAPAAAADSADDTLELHLPAQQRLHTEEGDTIALTFGSPHQTTSLVLTSEASVAASLRPLPVGPCADVDPEVAGILAVQTRELDAAYSRICKLWEESATAEREGEGESVLADVAPIAPLAPTLSTRTDGANAASPASAAGAERSFMFELVGGHLVLVVESTCE
jgi:hypothetical protein